MRIPLLLFCLVNMIGCRARVQDPAPLETAYPYPLELSGLRNVYRVSSKLISGSGPDDRRAIQALRDLGVKTIISVDGAKPDVALAKEHGLRYVHLPIGYDGIPYDQGLRLARAVRDLPGLIYIHCHHGKHRSPAAVAAIQRCLDPQCQATHVAEWLRMAGTDPNYRGLHAVSEKFSLLSPEQLDQVSADFPEMASTNALVTCMVSLDEAWEHLKLIRTASWKTPQTHPALEPTHEALLFLEGYREAIRLPAVQKNGELLRLMHEATNAATDLQRALQPTLDGERVERAFQQSTNLCTRCHRRFRDVPK